MFRIYPGKCRDWSIYGQLASIVKYNSTHISYSAVRYDKTLFSPVSYIKHFHNKQRHPTNPSEKKNRTKNELAYSVDMVNQYISFLLDCL